MTYCKNGDVRFNAIVKGKSKSAQIWLIYNFGRRRLRYYTGKRIELNNWDESKQRVKTQAGEAATINKHLKMLASFIEKTYTDAVILEQLPTVEYLREKLKTREFKDTTPVFFTHFETFIAENKNHLAPSTIIKYGNTKNHLESFAKKKNYTIEFNSIDDKFYHLFYDYLIEAELTNNTIAKVLKTLKVFMKYAAGKRLHNKMDFGAFKSSEVEGEIVFLTWEELMALYNLKLTIKIHDMVRDVFCFQCFTGLRYSDIRNLRKDSVVGDFLHVNIMKKREKKIVSVPLVSYAKEILAKYSYLGNGKLLPTISSQTMNKTIKLVGAGAKINEPVIIVQYRGAEKIETVHPKCEVLSTHIGRKTFITNALDREVPAEVVMSISDHSTHKAFKRYYKVFEERKKKELFKAFDHEKTVE